MPKEYRFVGNQVRIQKVGNGVLLLPEGDSWDALEEGANQFSTDFMQDREQGNLEGREELFG